MLKTIYDLILVTHNDMEGRKYSYYRNDFYALEVYQGKDDVITETVVTIVNDELKELPEINVYYENEWKYEIKYGQVKMSINNYEGVGSEYVASCQAGQISAAMMVEKLNELEEFALLEAQRQFIETEIREQMILEMLNPIEGEDCSHWRDKPWSPKKLNV